MCQLFINADSRLWTCRTKSLRIDGVVTSIRLEEFFWDILEEVAFRDQMTVNQMITKLYLESLEELLRLATVNDYNNSLSVVDSTFLCDSKQFGYDVVKKLGLNGIKTVHTFAQDPQESRRQKVGFYMGDARIKATTLHSFKGWESRALVIHVGSKTDLKTLALIYTGLTRLKRHEEGSCLTVVSSSEKLLDYGKTWPEFEMR